jgi:hypothetical protein
MGGRHRQRKLQPASRRRWRLWPGSGRRSEGRAKAPRRTKVALREQTVGARTGRSSAAAAAKRAAARRTARPPAPTPREQQARRRARLRLALALVAVMILGAGGVGLYRGIAWLRARPLFNLQGFDVVVDGIGGPGTGAAYFEDRYLASHRGESVFALDLAALRDEVQADPWVERAVVTRWLPDRLRLRVAVREAVAVVTAGMHAWLVDPPGRVIEETEDPGTAWDRRSAAGSNSRRRSAAPSPRLRPASGADFRPRTRSATCASTSLATR